MGDLKTQFHFFRKKWYFAKTAISNESKIY